MNTGRARIAANAIPMMCAVVLLLAPGSARGSGINLAWDDCGPAGQTLQSFACDTHDGAPWNLVASFVPPGGVSGFVGVTGEIRIASLSLPDWWKHGFGQCRGGAGLFPDVTFAPAACSNPWPGSQLADHSYRPDPEDPNTAFITITVTMPADEAVALSPASEYFAFALRLVPSKVTGVDACAGCAEPVRLTLERIQLHQAPGGGEDPVVDTPIAGNVVSWQSSVGSTPQILGLAPDGSPPGSDVEITGTGLTSAWSVRFGTSAAAFVVESDDRIRATVPAMAETGPVHVQTPFGSASSAADFRVPPVVVDFLPRQAPVGAQITVHGLNFLTATAVAFNGVPATFTVQSASLIRATVPEGVADGPIAVSSPDGVGSSSADFRLGVAEGALNLSWDDCGTAGTELKTFVCTTNFGPFPLVASFVPPPGVDELLGMTAELRVASDALPNWWSISGQPCRGLCASVNFVSNPGACVDPWLNRGGQAFQALDLGYYGPGTARLRIWCYATMGPLDPATEYNAFRIVVATHHSPSHACDTVQEPIDFALEEIRLLGPAGASTLVRSPLTRNTARWQGSSARAPQIVGFSPPAGPPGSAVTVDGSHFSEAFSVRMGGAEASFKVMSDTEISATVPADGRTGPIRVASPYGAAATEESFTVAPRILSFTPRQAEVGNSVWLIGENFTGTTSIRFHDGAAAAFEVLSDEEIRATVPSGATDGSIRVENPGGHDTSDLEFRVGAVSQPGVNLSWDDCGGAGMSLITFACDTNLGPPIALVASFVPPPGVSEFVGLSATLTVLSDSEILPDWWRHGPTYCRGTSRLASTFDFRAGPYTCQDVFQGLGAGGYDYESHYSTPNQARLRVQCAVPFENRRQVDETDEYYAFKILILRSKTVGDGACAGCDVPVCITLDDIQLFQPAARGFDPVIAQVDGRNYVAWQPGSAICTEKTTTPVLVSVVTAEATSDRVRLVWQTEDVERATVHRREGASTWRHLATLAPDGLHRVTYEDTDVTPGATYEYRLGIPAPTGEIYLGETQVTVPALAPTPLALARVAWDGSVGALAVSLSLPRAGSASFELYDVNGRRLMGEHLDGLGPGSHELQLKPGQPLKPSVYFARITQNGEGVSRRFVVVQ